MANRPEARFKPGSQVRLVRPNKRYGTYAIKDISFRFPHNLMRIRGEPYFDEHLGAGWCYDVECVVLDKEVARILGVPAGYRMNYSVFEDMLDPEITYKPRRGDTCYRLVYESGSSLLIWSKGNNDWRSALDQYNPALKDGNVTESNGIITGKGFQLLPVEDMV